MNTINFFKNIGLLLFGFIIMDCAQAQIGIGITPPDPSAMLHVQDTARGMLIPRLTEAQKNAIQNPANGLLIYQTNNTEGFWVYKNNQWQALVSANNGGKQTLILADKITNSEALAKIAAEAGPNTQEVRIIRCTNLTTVDLSMLTGVTQVIITDNAVLQDVNLASLKYIDEILSIKNCPQLASLTLSSLEKVGDSYVAGQGGIQITNSGLASQSFPLLSQVSGPINIIQNASLTGLLLPLLNLVSGGITINQNGLLSLSMPALIEVSSSLTISQNLALSSVSFPQLTKVGAFMLFNRNLTSADVSSLVTAKSIDFQQNAIITSFSFPALTTVTNTMSISGDTALTNLSLPALASVQTLNLYNNKALASLGCPALVTGTVTFYNQTPLTTISLPVLVSGGLTINSGCSTISSVTMPLFSSGAVSIEGPTSLTSLSLPAFTSGTFSLINSPSMTSISMPVAILTFAKIRNNANLSAFSFNGFANTTNASFEFDGNNFPSSLVNYFLNKLVIATPLITNKTIYLSQLPAAPPTGQGITDKAVLISRANTVNTD